MRVIDPGHKYALTHLDGEQEEILTFVKREGPGYPGNVGAYEGTNIQEVLRALIDRLKYLDGQIHHLKNTYAISRLRQVILDLEDRAAQRHNRYPAWMIAESEIELMPVCRKCGHIGCRGTCHAKLYSKV